MVSGSCIPETLLPRNHGVLNEDFLIAAFLRAVALSSSEFPLSLPPINALRKSPKTRCIGHVPRILWYRRWFSRSATLEADTQALQS